MKTDSVSCKKIFFTKLTHNHGISLITLVITIVVVIILAAAVVMSLNNNNVLTNASSARYTTDLDTMQSYLELTIQKVSLRHQGTITWESTDIGNLSGEIIFDEGTDTDTTFYTGYKLPVYGSETKWYVDENGKLILQTGSRIYGADELPKPKINAATISKDPQKYYGAYVDYTTTNTLSEDYKWRIFYATNNNIYLISLDYISVADLPATAKGNKPANTNSKYPKAAPFRNIINDYTGSASIAEDMKWLNKDYFNKEYSSTNNNMKAVAYLLDKSIWTDKFKGNGAEYIVGAPSLDMILTSYNQYTNQSNMYQSRAENSIGYNFSENSGSTWLSSSSSGSKYLTKGNGLYGINDQSNSYAYWVSSPSCYGDYGVMYVNYGGYISYDYYIHNSLGFRPIICLKSNIKLTEIEEGKVYSI